MRETYRPPDPDRWKGRPSGSRQYLHECVRMLSLDQTPLARPPVKTAALLGYASDEGVRRNRGRPGAAAGPTALREALGKLPWPETGIQVADAGDIITKDEDLENTRESFASQIHHLIRSGYFPVGLGGGHDMAYAHYTGVRRALPKSRRLAIVNFDAHLDLRLPEPLPHSGSPFSQIAADCKATGDSFQYACLGARKDANPAELWERARELNALVVSRDEMDLDPQALQRFQSYLEESDALYMTIDLDGFSSAFAPGVSAASPWGFGPMEIMPWLQAVLDSGKLVSVDLAELNPAFDRDSQTAALAAGLLHRILLHPGLF